MSDSLIRDIQSEAIEGKVDYARLLRKAKIAAVKLSQPTAITWIDSEINGYRCLYEELPKYRQAKGELKAINPYHGLIPFMVNNHELHEAFTNAPIAGGVGTLAALLTEDRDQLQYQFSARQKSALMKSMSIQMEPVLIIPETAIITALEGVTSLVLDWSLELERRGFWGKG